MYLCAVQIPGLTVYEVTKIAQVYDIMRKGAACRATSKTQMNERSSRSHSVFMLTIEQWSGYAFPRHCPREI